MTLQWVFRWRGMNWGLVRTVQRPTPARTERVTLQTAQVLARELSAGTRITSESGTIWLTLPGEIKDHVLAPGQSFTLPQHGKAVMQAMGEAGIVRIADALP